MSTNVKFLNQKDTGSSKNCLHKKFNLNSKAIPSKSFRQKIEKSKNTKQPLGVINENDINQGNVKSKNSKESQIKKIKTMANRFMVAEAKEKTHLYSISVSNLEKIFGSNFRSNYLLSLIKIAFSKAENFKHINFEILDEINRNIKTW